MLAFQKKNEPITSKKKISAVSIQGKGRGVIAKTYIAKDEIIETCPVLIPSLKEQSSLDASFMERYFFSWSNPGQYSKEYKDLEQLWTIPAGHAMLYNHSTFANADYNLDFPGRTIIFTAMRDIPPVSEICINYNMPLWFEER